MQLRFAEEVMLLLLDDEGERFLRVPDWSLRYALGGGVLMDLAFEDRIDTDLEKLVLVDSTPLGDELLDPMLAEIAAREGTHNARFWVERAAARSGEIREAAIERLIGRGILEQKEDRFLWVFRSRRYPVLDDGTAEREVKLRIMELLFSDMIPTPRDVVIICLADACGIFAELLSRRELQQALPRIQFLRQMDLIGQAVTAAVWDIEVSLAQAIRPHFG